MNNSIFYILGFLILIPIFIAYYIDYKMNPKEFKLSLGSLLDKRLRSALLLLIIYLSLNKIYEHTTPFNKNNGIEFNVTREKLGIPTINSTWELDKKNSSQFEMVWINLNLKHRHFKKSIEYGFFEAKTETDFYKAETENGIFFWSVYHFKTNTFEYFIEKPNNKSVSVTDSGKLKFEKPTFVNKINKSSFDVLRTN